jgi:hypothetical protein
VGLSPRENFIRATFALSKSSPMAWFDFLEALNVYVAEEVERGLGTTTDEAMIALGMSRRIVNMRNDFRDIERLAQKIKVTS